MKHNRNNRKLAISMKQDNKNKMDIVVVITNMIYLLSY